MTKPSKLRYKATLIEKKLDEMESSRVEVPDEDLIGLYERFVTLYEDVDLPEEVLKSFANILNTYIFELRISRENQESIGLMRYNRRLHENDPEKLNKKERKFLAKKSEERVSDLEDRLIGLCEDVKTKLELTKRLRLICDKIRSLDDNES